ncbi:DIC protein, partial [Atractosteus spatula]|nr:DIC protein [Atractosteus spatula]
MAEKRVSRWYFGGLASCGAACCTHPLDLLKESSKLVAMPFKKSREKKRPVHLQTQQEVKMRMTGMALHVIRQDGVLALYNGLSASLCRQMTYSLTRFAIYETVRDWVCSGSQGPLPFYQKVLLGAFGGFTGGFIGTPADMVNVRMQNDVKLPAHLRRNYAHALDGMIRVWREEGLRKLFSGATMASSRGALVTVGQLSCYDQAKQLVLGTGLLSDNIFTHFLASFIAGGCATFLCQPLDVMKTRLMNSKGEYRGVMHCMMETAKLGPLAFYKGFVPAAIRLVPHTVLTFVFLEQLRKNFGIIVVHRDFTRVEPPPNSTSLSPPRHTASTPALLSSSAVARLSKRREAEGMMQQACLSSGRLQGAQAVEGEAPQRGWPPAEQFGSCQAGDLKLLDSKQCQVTHWRWLDAFSQALKSPYAPRCGLKAETDLCCLVARVESSRMLREASLFCAFAMIRRKKVPETSDFCQELSRWKNHFSGPRQAHSEAGMAACTCNGVFLLLAALCSLPEGTGHRKADKISTAPVSSFSFPVSDLIEPQLRTWQSPQPSHCADRTRSQPAISPAGAQHWKSTVCNLHAGHAYCLLKIRKKLHPASPCPSLNPELQSLLQKLRLKVPEAACLMQDQCSSLLSALLFYTTSGRLKQPQLGQEEAGSVRGSGGRCLLLRDVPITVKKKVLLSTHVEKASARSLRHHGRAQTCAVCAERDEGLGYWHHSVRLSVIDALGCDTGSIGWFQTEIKSSHDAQLSGRMAETRERETRKTQDLVSLAQKQCLSSVMEKIRSQRLPKINLVRSNANHRWVAQHSLLGYRRCEPSGVQYSLLHSSSRYTVITARSVAPALSHSPGRPVRPEGDSVLTQPCEVSLKHTGRGLCCRSRGSGALCSGTPGEKLPRAEKQLTPWCELRRSGTLREVSPAPTCAGRTSRAERDPAPSLEDPAASAAADRGVGVTSRGPSEQGAGVAVSGFLDPSTTSQTESLVALSVPSALLDYVSCLIKLGFYLLPFRALEDVPLCSGDWRCYRTSTSSRLHEHSHPAASCSWTSSPNVETSRSISYCSTVLLQVRSELTLTNIVKNWVSYKDECNHNISSEPPATGLVCNRTFDRYACWPDGLPNTVVNVSCPWYLPWHDRVRHGVVYRVCGLDGQWVLGPDKHPWKNTTECEVDDTDKRDYWKTLSMFWVMYTVGHSLSLGALVLALGILVAFSTPSFRQHPLLTQYPLLRQYPSSHSTPSSHSAPSSESTPSSDSMKQRDGAAVITVKLHCMRNYIHMNLFASFILRAVSILVKDALLPSSNFTLPKDNEVEKWLNSTDETPVGCRAALVMMQYSIMANYNWLLVEGIYLHNLLVITVFTERNYFKIYLCIAWGAPLLFVLPWVMLKYLYENSHCILGHLLTIDPPCINFFIFIRIIKILVSKLRAHQMRYTDYKVRLAKSTLTLIPLLGIHEVVFAFVTDEHAQGSLRLVKLFFELFSSSFQVSQHSTHREVRCWERNLNMAVWWVIRSPILLAILINFFIFIRIIKILVSKLRAHQMRYTDYKVRLAKSTLTLIPLLGIHEVVFAFVTDEHAQGSLRLVKLFFELFSSSFQGLLVAILYCFVNKEVQSELLKRWKRWKLGRDIEEEYRHTYSQTPHVRNGSTAAGAAPAPGEEHKLVGSYQNGTGQSKHSLQPPAPLEGAACTSTLKESGSLGDKAHCYEFPLESAESNF